MDDRIAVPGPVWLPSMSVGIETLDRDHCAILGLAARLERVRPGVAGYPEVEGLLSLLSIYSEKHFRREERMMEALGYPDRDGHRAQHERGRCLIRRHAARFLRQPAAADPGELGEGVSHWLVQHILTVDMAYRDWADGDSDTAKRILAQHTGVIGADYGPITPQRG